MPSQDFFGLIEGAIGCLPKRRRPRSHRCHWRRRSAMNGTPGPRRRGAASRRTAKPTRSGTYSATSTPAEVSLEVARRPCASRQRTTASAVTRKPATRPVGPPGPGGRHHGQRHRRAAAPAAAGTARARARVSSTTATRRGAEHGEERRPPQQQGRDDGRAPGRGRRRSRRRDCVRHGRSPGARWSAARGRGRQLGVLRLEGLRPPLRHVGLTSSTGTDGAERGTARSPTSGTGPVSPSAGRAERAAVRWGGRRPRRTGQPGAEPQRLGPRTGGRGRSPREEVIMGDRLSGQTSSSSVSLFFMASSMPCTSAR